jgi:hypothetical protein
MTAAWIMSWKVPSAQYCAGYSFQLGSPKKWGSAVFPAETPFNPEQLTQADLDPVCGVQEESHSRFLWAKQWWPAKTCIV